jgi:hypothetical protein
VQARIRQITRPLQRAADRVEQATESTVGGQPPTVQIKPPGLMSGSRRAQRRSSRPP